MKWIEMRIYRISEQVQRHDCAVLWFSYLQEREVLVSFKNEDLVFM